jgi:hypothetical protein
LVYACQKELSLSKPATFERGALRQFFNKNGAALQTYSAMAPGYIRITAAKGTTVSFPENAFVTMNNTPVSGEVMIEVKEIYTPADMILSNTPTTSNGLPLESGGAFFVQAMQNGQALKLAPGKFIQLGFRKCGQHQHGWHAGVQRRYGLGHRQLGSEQQSEQCGNP